MSWSRGQRVLLVGVGITLATAMVALGLLQPRALASDAPDAPGTPGFSPGSFIFNEPDRELFLDFDRMAAFGAKWVRLDVPWASIEEKRGSFYWDSTDRLINAARQRGLQVVGLLHTTPEWARPPGTTFLSPPVDPKSYAAFARAAAQRYGNTVKVWEVWNEPNLHIFWNPKPDAARYTALLREAYPAIKGAAAGTTVLFGGLSPATDAVDGSEISPLTFLSRAYAAGAKGAFDAMAMHPYSYPARPTDPATAEWNTFYRLPKIYDLMVANGDGAKKIWLTEFGAPTGAHPTAVSESQQALILNDGFAAAAQSPWAGPLLWYAHRDSGTDPADREQNFGLLRSDFSRKSAAGSYEQAAGVGASTTSPVSNATTTTVGTSTPSGTTAPTGLTVTGRTSSTVSLSWKPVTGATEYRAYVSRTSGSGYFLWASGFTATSATLYSLTGDYYIVVRAVVVGVESPNSNEVSTATGATTATTTTTTTVAPAVAPTTTTAVARTTTTVGTSTPSGTTAPTGLTVTGRTSSTVSLSWKPVTGATEYRAYVSRTSGSGYFLWASGFTATSATLYSLTGDYYIVVRAVVVGVESPNSNEVSTATGATTATTATTANTTTTTVAPAVAPTTTTTVARTTTTVGTSTPSGTTAPTGLTVTGRTSSTVSLSWKPVTGATEYRVYVSTVPGHGYILYASGFTSPPATVYGLNGTWYIVVRAVVAGAESPNSNEVST